MQLEMIQNNEMPRRGRGRVEARVRYTDRDVEIIRFLLEMRFALAKEIYQKFFEVLQSGSQSVSESWARERLGLLVKSGLIKTARHPVLWKAVYLPTRKGYHLVRDRQSEFMVPQPIRHLDLRTVHHDGLLLSARMVFEKQHTGGRWISDRVLGQDHSLLPGLGKAYYPDALLITPGGSRIAFELELTQKSKARYVEKVRKYVNWMRESGGSPLGCERVIYWVTRESVCRLLRDLTRIHPNRFEVLKVDEGKMNSAGFSEFLSSATKETERSCNILQDNVGCSR